MRSRSSWSTAGSAYQLQGNVLTPTALMGAQASGASGGGAHERPSADTLGACESQGSPVHAGGATVCPPSIRAGRLESAPLACTRPA